MQLEWGCYSPTMLSVQPDIILAADVLYDPAVIPTLLSVLQKLLMECGGGHGGDGSGGDGSDGHCIGGGRSATAVDSVMHGQGATHAGTSNPAHPPCALIATRVRNEATLQLFLTQAVEEYGLCVEEYKAVQDDVRFVHLDDATREAVLLHLVSAK